MSQRPAGTAREYDNDPRGDPHMNGLAPLRSPVALLSAFATLCALLATALAVLAPPANAAAGGSLTITPTSGTLDTKPAFETGEFTGSCPEAYRPGEGKPFAVLPLLEAPDGRTQTLGSKTKDLTANGTKNTFAMAGGLNFSLGSRLLSTQPQGRYAIVVRCAKSTTGDLRGQDYRVPIDVTAEGWSVATPGAPTDVQVTAESVAVPGTAEVQVKATLTVTPATLTGTAYVYIGGKATTVPVTGGTAVVTSAAQYALGTEVQVEAMVNPADRVANEPSTTWTAYTAATPATPTPTSTATPTGTPTPTATPTTGTEEPTDGPTDEPTEPADLDVTDEEGNTLDANPVLEAGQKVLVTARGYTKDATVQAVLSDSGATLADATADAEGTVKDYEFTVPEDIADGDHTLTLTEDAADGHSVAFAFVTGAATSPSPDPDATGGTDTGGTAAGGTDGGTTGGDTGGSTDTPAGPLASTGSEIAAFGLGALALIALGAACVIHVRRKGLLAFGSTPGH
ncbi:hypothetical protein [Streptomyces sp. NBC_00059]|uniref:hypothetical protein n=1 Tax=Streptomyces sp. NBC_00059 TaxID=2975635 RepID=UPI0022559016|nr:hypothetical protein [Streptomyces sp. NBC_00059]MCX5410510.1 hypothetical protein [Streptomyces sp. NBC_00059]